MVDLANKFINETFEENVPMKKVRICENHISALTNETKLLMKERNSARRSGNYDAYKKLRNKANRLIRQDKTKK